MIVHIILMILFRMESDVVFFFLLMLSVILTCRDAMFILLLFGIFEVRTINTLLPSCPLAILL